MEELGDNEKEEETNDITESYINNIANKMANILYITSVSMKENFQYRNNLPYAKFINDMKSYCVNLIQSINNLNGNFFNLTSLPVHSIPRNPYTNTEEVDIVTNNISVDDTIEKIKENKYLYNDFKMTYKKNNLNVLKQIETFNEYLGSSLNSIDHIKAPMKYEEKTSYGNIVSERLKDKPKDFKRLEFYIAKINYGLF